MNCATNTKGLIKQGITYERSFEFEMPDPDSPNLENPNWTPMDLSLYNIQYLIQINGRKAYEQLDNFDIVDNMINIKIDPTTTATFPIQTYKEQFIFTLISDPTENRVEYSGDIQVISKWQ
jgi:hypothetical protein